LEIGSESTVVTVEGNGRLGEHRASHNSRRSHSTQIETYPSMAATSWISHNLSLAFKFRMAATSIRQRKVSLRFLSVAASAVRRELRWTVWTFLTKPSAHDTKRACQLDQRIPGQPVQPRSLNRAHFVWNSQHHDHFWKNTVHGEGFYNYRSDGTSAAIGDPAAEFNRKQYGVNSAERSSKDKLFGFGSWERTTQDLLAAGAPRAPFDSSQHL